MRLPANCVMQNKIGYLPKCPVGRSSHEVRRYYASFHRQAQSWTKPMRVVAKLEWRASFTRASGAFYNQRSAAEQRIKDEE